MSVVNGSKAIEDAAIAWAIRYEHSQGRTAIDTRYKGAATDISSPPRVIEVKACGGSARSQDLWLETRQVEEACINPAFWLYVIENVAQGDPAGFTLKAIGGEQLQRLLERAREKHYYDVPWPVADYDQSGPR